MDYLSHLIYIGLFPYILQTMRSTSVCFLIFFNLLALAYSITSFINSLTFIGLYTSWLLILNVIIPFLAIEISLNLSCSNLSLCELPSTSMATFIFGKKISAKYILSPHCTCFCTSILKCVLSLRISNIFNSGIVLFSINSFLLFKIQSLLFIYFYKILFLNFESSDNGELERKETLIGRVQKFDFPPLPTGFSIIGIKEPLYEERKRYHRNSSSVSQVSAVQAQTSASCYRTPSDCSDRILRHCGRFKNSSNRVPVHKTVMGKNKTLTPVVGWHKGFYMVFGLRLHNISKTLHHDHLVTVQKYYDFPNHARNVKTPLTFWRSNNIRKIAARGKSVIYNDLHFRKLSNIAESKDERWCKTPYLSGLPP